MFITDNVVNASALYFPDAELQPMSHP